MTISFDPTSQDIPAASLATPSYKSLLRLDGKVVLVTGCGSSGPGWGNGKAISVLFARQGAKVYGVDLNLDAAQITALLIAEEGFEVEVAACNVTQASSVEAMVNDCVARFGRIDILVNNVGRSEPGGPVEMNEVRAK